MEVDGADDDHNRSIFDMSIQGHSDRYALEVLKFGWSLVAGVHRIPTAQRCAMLPRHRKTLISSPTKCACRELVMSDRMNFIPFQADATESLLSMLRKLEHCESFSADERFEIDALKFLVLRARLRAAQGAPTLSNSAGEFCRCAPPSRQTGVSPKFEWNTTTVRPGSC
jgi:hypothetical protein